MQCNMVDIVGIIIAVTGWSLDMLGSVLTVVDVDSVALGSSSGCFAAVGTISYNIPFSLLLTFNISGESCFSAGRGVVVVKGVNGMWLNTRYIQRRYLQVCKPKLFQFQVTKFKCLLMILGVFYCNPKYGVGTFCKYCVYYCEISLTL